MFGNSSICTTVQPKFVSCLSQYRFSSRHRSPWTTDPITALYLRLPRVVPSRSPQLNQNHSQFISLHASTTIKKRRWVCIPPPRARERQFFGDAVRAVAAEAIASTIEHRPRETLLHHPSRCSLGCSSSDSSLLSQ